MAFRKYVLLANVVGIASMRKGEGRQGEHIVYVCYNLVCYRKSGLPGMACWILGHAVRINQRTCDLAEIDQPCPLAIL